MKRILTLFLLITLITCCKKTWTCECSNIDGKSTALTHRGKKEEAKLKCQRYYEETYGHVVGDETKCRIKE